MSFALKGPQGEALTNYQSKTLRHHEKQRLLEIRYSTGDIGINGCTDSHQHYFVYGTWSYLYVKQMPPLIIAEALTCKGFNNQ